MKRRIIKITGAAVLSAALLSGSVIVAASGLGYGNIQETEDAEVIRITEEVGERYGVCPEVLQALIFYESSNQRTARSRGGCIGYMQVSPKWQGRRMEELGVYDLTDAYGNILLGTDYLAELCGEYGDIALALTAYNRGSADGGYSGYAQRILELSEKLERKHGK